MVIVSEFMKEKVKNIQKKLPGLLFLLLLLQTVSYAQFENPEDIVSFKSYLSQDKVYAGGEVKLAVKISIDNSWHINSNKPKEDYLIPTQLKMTADSAYAFELTYLTYPKAKDLMFDFSDTPVSVYEGDEIITGIIKVPKGIKPGEYSVKLSLDFQPCNNKTCLPPAVASEEIKIVVADSGSVIVPVNQELFSQLTAPAVMEGASSGGSLADKLESSGIVLGLLLVFLGGLALNLTPCVYPLIPITVGYFGGQSEGNTAKLFMFGLLYLLGMALTYSIIGVITALSGAVFGALLQNPVVIIAIAMVLFALSLSMFGVYEFKLPDTLVAKAGGARGGYFGAFFMGLTMGVVAAPCIGPFVLGLVTYVGAKADPLLGFLMFFTLAVGLGLPYVFLALFSGKLKSLPRAGFWMEAVKHIFGFLLLGMALYFLLPLLPETIRHYLMPVYMIIAALYLIFVDKVANNMKGFRIFKTAFSVLIIAVSIYMLIPVEKKSPDWKYFSDSLYEQAVAGKQPIIIDFYADWCIPCKELDAMTFSDERVVRESGRFSTFKVDMTKSASETTERIRNKFKIVGMPTVLIINSQGEEVHRLTGFVKADEFHSIISKVN